MTDGTPAQTKSSPHWVLRAFALLGAAFAAFSLAFIAWSAIRNRASIDFSVFPWMPLSMLACMLALLWSGISLFRAESNAAFVVFVTMMLMGVPWMLIGFALAFAD